VRWILLDVLVVLLCAALLVVVALRLWRQVKALGTTVGAAAARLDEVTAQLSTVGERSSAFATTTPAGHDRGAPQPGRGLGSTTSL
jgi:hypothetical protein